MRIVVTFFMLVIAFVKVGAIFLVFLFDVTFVAMHLKKDSSSCAARSAGAGMGPPPDLRRLTGAEGLVTAEAVHDWEQQDLHELYPAFYGKLDYNTSMAYFAEEGEIPLLRRLVDTNRSSWGPVSPGEMGPAMKKVFYNMGLDIVGDFFNNLIETWTKMFDWLLSTELFIPDSANFKCTGIRRLMSASAVLGCVGIVLVITLMDVLSVLEATKEIAKARAGSAHSFVQYVMTIAKVQMLEFFSIQLLQVTISSGSRLKFEASGYFDQNCGYLVKTDNLPGDTCPNFWHLPVEALSAFLLFFGLALAVTVFIATLSGTFYGLSTAKWVMEAFFGKDLQLSNFGGEQKMPKNTDWMGSRLEHQPFLRLAMRPFMGLAVSLGVWTTWTSRTYMCGMRQDWYEPLEQKGEKEDDASDDEESAGAADLVSWKAMYHATAKSIAVVWVPIPLFGSLMSKTTQYLNEHVFLAFGNDGGGPTGENERIITHMQEERAAGVQALHWISQASLVAILFIIEFDLLRGFDQESRLIILGSCVLSVLLLASVRMSLDVTQQFKTFKSGRGLIDAVEEVVKNDMCATIANQPGGEPGAPLRGLPEEDRRRLLLACRELLELPWCQQKRLPREQRTFLLSPRILASPRTQVAVFALKALDNNKAHVTDALTQASSILALHEASGPEIAWTRARLQAHKRACTLAEERARSRGAELQRWLEDQARAEASREARRRAEVFEERRQQGGDRAPGTPVGQRCVNIVLMAHTKGVVRVTAIWKKGEKVLLEKPREVAVRIDAEVEARIEWAPRNDPKTISSAAVLIVRSWHKIGDVVSVAKAPVDPSAHVSMMGAQKVSGAIKGQGTASDDGDDDADPESGDQLYGLEWLESEMNFNRACKCCHRAQAMKKIGGWKADEEKWQTKDLDTRWSRGEHLGDAGEDNHDQSMSHNTVSMNRKMWPDLDPAPTVNVDEEETMGDLEKQLEWAIRNSIYDVNTILHSATFLKGLNQDKSGKASRRARLLGVVRRMMQNRERRDKEAEAKAAARPPPAPEDVKEEEEEEEEA
mmetsp:Transcript_44710/g.142666  ORF Transcript_44710/g.142666 Transcript_44710/m.142666 type:complete len:1047 (-) Transcript_44710:23-3163(-)